MNESFKFTLAIATIVLLIACTEHNKNVTNLLNAFKRPALPAGIIEIAGKEWMRCSLGQTWYGNTCVGKANRYTFDSAKYAVLSFNNSGYAGKHDWRVPTIRELQSLRVCSSGFLNQKTDLQDGGEVLSRGCNPSLVAHANMHSIDLTAFPKTPSSFYCSSSLYAGVSASAWLVYFYYGAVNFFSSNDYASLRLVRCSGS